MRNGSIGNGVARVENVEARPAANYPRKQSKALTGIEVKSAIPKRRQDLLKWNGWGYKDSEFILKDDVIAFTGDRYPIGNLELPYFTDWVHIMFDVDVNIKTDRQPLPKETDYPRSLAGPELVQEFEDLGISTSIEGIDRLIRSHGQTLHDIDVLRRKVFTRIPDIVLWPTCHEEVVEIVKVADKRNLVIIPYGGGTSVSGAVGCPEEERRVITSLDTSQMNDILWVDSSNLVVCCESGILGQDLERELRKLGYTAGHEPDSYEFSSLGGWVATRASGMKKNTYGNIEDLVVHVRMVTPRGVLEKGCRVPRISCGPDFQQVILGSEGSLGVVTEVVLKIRPLPKCIKYGSLVFPEFESGVKCMREVARERCQPSSIRLMDNEQFKFGQALRPVPSYFGYFMDGIKHLVLTKVKGFDLNQICVATLLFEGNAEDVAVQEKKINAIAAQFGGIAAGQTNGERGYVLTFVIAYIRDLAYNYDIIAESFETSVPWDRTSALCRNVKHRVRQECKHHSIKHFLISCRVTQTYDAGACVYFYFGFHSSNFENAMEIYELIEERARDEIIACGGSISHHHGVGKLRKKWYQQTVSVPGLELYQATKRQLDPKNIFANANLVDTVTEDSGSSQDVLAKSKL